MDKLLLILSSLLLFGSCAEQFSIAGDSSVPCLDGRMLYLRVSPDRNVAMVKESRFRSLDSCKVVHGRFTFEGDIDSTMMAMLYTGNQCVMPIVLENGKLNIEVSNASQSVSGGPLNERLYTFFKKRNRLDNELWELQQQTIRMMREGKTPEEIHRKVGKKAEKLTRQTEELETRFVQENYDNVLGPGFFMLLCNQYPSPILTEQIQKIVDGAPSIFLNDTFVHSYLKQARMRMPNIQVMSPTTIQVNCP